MSQKLHASCETSLVLTCVPQKNFDVKRKMFICVTFFSKSNADELLERKCHSAPQMKFMVLGATHNSVFYGGLGDETFLTTVRAFLTQLTVAKSFCVLEKVEN